MSVFKRTVISHQFSINSETLIPLRNPSSEQGFQTNVYAAVIQLATFGDSAMSIVHKKCRVLGTQPPLPITRTENMWSVYYNKLDRSPGVCWRQIITS